MQRKYLGNDAIRNGSGRKTRGVDNLGTCVQLTSLAHVRLRPARSLFSRGSSYVDCSLYVSASLEISE